MAELLRIQPQVPRLDPGQLRVPTSGGAILGRGLEELGGTFEKIQDAADTAEASKVSQVMAAQWDAAVLKARDANADDPDEFSRVANESIQTINENGLAQLNPRAKNLVSSRVAGKMTQLRSKIEHDSYGMKLDKAKVNWMTARDEAINRRLSTDDPVEQSKIDAEIMGDLGALTKKGAFKVEDAYKERKGYALKVELGTLRIMEPFNFMARHEAGEFSHLPAEDVLKIAEDKGRTVQREEAVREGRFKDLKKIALDNINAAANRGEIRDSEMEDMLNGRSPYVTPTEARGLLEVNNNPRIGEGRDQVLAIMQEYHSGPSSFGRISKTRAELRALMRGAKRPNPTIDQAFNELQTDERTMTGIEASRVNRAGQEARIEFDATTTKTGIPLLDAQLPQERSQAELDARRGLEPKAAAKRRADEMKKKEDSVRTKHQKALDY